MTPRKNKAGRGDTYDISLKIAAAQEYLTGNLSFSQVAKKYNIAGGTDTVRWFVRWYQRKVSLKPDQSNSPPVEVNKASTGESEKDIQELEKQLAAANLKIAALETLIDVAENDLGIDIRKKRGTKQ